MAMFSQIAAQKDFAKRLGSNSYIKLKDEELKIGPFQKPSYLLVSCVMPILGDDELQPPIHLVPQKNDIRRFLSTSEDGVWLSHFFSAMELDSVRK